MLQVKLSVYLKTVFFEAAKASFQHSKQLAL